MKRAEKQPAHHKRSDKHQQACNICTDLQIFRRMSFAAHKNTSDNGRNQTDRGNRQREQRTGKHLVGHCFLTKQQSQRDGGNDRSAVAFEKVSTHSGNVANIVADIVRNNGGVSRVVLGDTGFHLTDKVRTDVGGLRINSAAHTGKQSD